MKAPAWTAEEDALVRRLCTSARGRRRLGRLLPRRSPSALAGRASKLGVVRPHRRWTGPEKTLLAREWGESSPSGLLAKLPGRTWGAIVDQAKTLGLGSPAQGLVPLTAAARTAGYAVRTLRRILAATGVALRPHRGGTRAQGRAHPRWLVDPERAREAVEQWLARPHETLAEGARRHSTTPAALRLRLERLGAYAPVGRGVGQRLDPAIVDRAMALRIVNGARRPGGLAAACAAAGVPYRTAMRIVAERGLTGQRGRAHGPGVVRAVVAELAARRAS